MDSMQPLGWSPDDSVFVPQLDGEHEKLFEHVERIQQLLAKGWGFDESRYPLGRFTRDFLSHLENEERLMRMSRYTALNWHEHQHQAGRAKLSRLMERVHGGNQQAMREALYELVGWLRDHISVADRMFAAHLRNDALTRLAS